MKTKAAKPAKKSKSAARVKDIKPKRDAKGGGDPNVIYISSGGGAWKTRNSG